MTSYQDLKDKPKRFHSLTGYTPEEFSAIAPTFSKCFLEFVETNTLDGERRKNGSIARIKIVSYPVLRISCCLFSFTCERQ